MRNWIAAAAALSMLAAAPAFAGRFPAGSPATTNNADSCDLGNFPAATLLLPYFEVDVTGPLKRTLLMTVTNTSEQAQIAKVVIWTDWGYPVLDFNLFLTGYDVQALNLADILVNGFIASPRGGPSIGAMPGELSRPNAANPNFAATVSNFCADGALPGQIPNSLRADVRSALTDGTAAACGTARIGGVHPFAAGYVTIDVVSTCTTTLPTEVLGPVAVRQRADGRLRTDQLGQRDRKLRRRESARAHSRDPGRRTGRRHADGEPSLYLL